MSIGYLQRKAAWEILLKVSYGDFSDHALDKVLKNYQFNFTRLEESIAIKLGRMLDAGFINIGCRLNS